MPPFIFLDNFPGLVVPLCNRKEYFYFVIQLIQPQETTTICASSAGFGDANRRSSSTIYRIQSAMIERLADGILCPFWEHCATFSANIGIHLFHNATLSPDEKFLYTIGRDWPIKNKNEGKEGTATSVTAPQCTPNTSGQGQKQFQLVILRLDMETFYFQWFCSTGNVESEKSEIPYGIFATNGGFLFIYAEIKAREDRNGKSIVDEEAMRVVEQPASVDYSHLTCLYEVELLPNGNGINCGGHGHFKLVELRNIPLPPKNPSVLYTKEFAETATPGKHSPPMGADCKDESKNFHYCIEYIPNDLRFHFLNCKKDNVDKENNDNVHHFSIINFDSNAKCQYLCTKNCHWEELMPASTFSENFAKILRDEYRKQWSVFSRSGRIFLHLHKFVCANGPLYEIQIDIERKSYCFLLLSECIKLGQDRMAMAASANSVVDGHQCSNFIAFSRSYGWRWRNDGMQLRPFLLIKMSTHSLMLSAFRALQNYCCHPENKEEDIEDEDEDEDENDNIHCDLCRIPDQKQIGDVVESARNGGKDFTKYFGDYSNFINSKDLTSNYFGDR